MATYSHCMDLGFSQSRRASSNEYNFYAHTLRSLMRGISARFIARQL